MAASVTERFLGHVVIDTQSDPKSQTQPSIERQRILNRFPVEELLEHAAGLRSK
jgi:tripeptide aminopeptidase